jgi:hypothetical protein
MWVARLVADSGDTLPDAPFVHLFVARGSVALHDGTDGGRPLVAGDAVRLTNAGALQVTATTDAEIIVWETDEQARR